MENAMPSKLSLPLNSSGSFDSLDSRLLSGIDTSALASLLLRAALGLSLIHI